MKWSQFEALFTEAHKDYMLFQTQNNHRFHAAAAMPVQTTTPLNTSEQTADALANLASATASDRMALENLTSTNERLSKHIEELTK